MHVIDWHAAAYGAAAGILVAGFAFLGYLVVRQAARRAHRITQRRVTRRLRAQHAALMAASLGTPAEPSRAEDWRLTIVTRPSVNPDTARPGHSHDWAA